MAGDPRPSRNSRRIWWRTGFLCPSAIARGSTLAEINRTALPKRHSRDQVAGKKIEQQGPEARTRLNKGPEKGSRKAPLLFVAGRALSGPSPCPLSPHAPPPRPSPVGEAAGCARLWRCRRRGHRGGAEIRSLPRG